MNPGQEPSSGKHAGWLEFGNETSIARSIGLPLLFAMGCVLSNLVAAPLWILAVSLISAGPAAAIKRPLGKVFLGLCLLGMGLAWGTLRTDDPVVGPVEAMIRHNPPGRPLYLWVKGAVRESEAWRDGSRIHLELDSFEDRGVSRSSGESVRAYLPVEPPLEGSRLEASLRLTLPRPATNPGQFDLRKYLDRKGIRLVGSCRSSALMESEPPGITGIVARYRAHLREAVMDGTGDAAPVLLALLLGERGLLDPETHELLSRSGLYHLVALSGLHVGLLLLLMMGAAHLLRLHPGLRDGVCLAVLCLYGLAVAPRPSLLRALLMAGMYLLARMAARPQAGWRAWSAAAAVLLAWNPRMILDTGFQMTFLATFGIIHLYDAYPLYLPRKGWASGLLRLLWVGFSAQLAVLPILVFHFHRFSLLGWLFTPLAALPIMGIQCAGLPYMAGGAFIPGLSGLLGRVLCILGKCFISVPERLAGWEGNSLFIPEPSILWAVLFGMGFLAVGMGGRFRRAGWVLIVFSLVGGWIHDPSGGRRQPPSLVVLDVGQASCQLLMRENRVWMVDAGNGSFRGPTSARQVIEPFLARAGIRTIDGILLTHWDTDHAGSLPDLLMDLHVGFVAYPATDPPERGNALRVANLCRKRRIALIPLNRGRMFETEGLEARILHPALNVHFEDENERCLVLEVPYGGKRMLFTGDIGEAAETDLVEGGGLSEIDILLVPHHGSGKSSTAAFLEALSPRWGLISVGWGNRFSHPSEAALERYRRLGIRLARTDLDGAIRIGFRDEGLSVQRYKAGGWDPEETP